MKMKGNYSKKTLLTIIYSRRWVLCTFCVNLIMELLQLGKEEENSKETENKGTIEDVLKESFKQLSPLLPEKDKSNPIESIKDSKIISKNFYFRKCGYFNCPNKETEENKFKVCGKCKKVPYCSRLCQQKHWKQDHKDKCQL